MKIAAITLILFVASFGLFAQDSIRDSQLLKARIMLNDYQDASKFQNASTGKFDESWVNIFKNCFDASIGEIIFDVPLFKEVHDSGSGDGGRKGIKELSGTYLKYVPIDYYINTIRSLYEDTIGFKLEYRFIEPGVNLNNNRMVVEIEKHFFETKWWLADTKKYLYEIKFTDEGAKIVSMRVMDEEFAKTDVELEFIYNSFKGEKDTLHGTGIADVVSRIKIDFDDDIYDRVLWDKSDVDGKIKLGQVANRARIFIDSVYGENDVKYTIPSEWKIQGSIENQRQIGKRVNQQPMGGFKIPLQPYNWSGWSFTPLIYGGLINQSANQLDNFSGNADFSNNMGIKLGVGIDVTYFFNPGKWNNNSGNWIFGVGSGFSISYLKFSLNSNGFDQNAYDYLDQVGDTCQILVLGFAFEEVIETVAVSVPFFVEAKKKLSRKTFGLHAFSIQAGVNLLLPVNSSYYASGTFSRHGLYPGYNSQVITEDEFYNYYTDVPKSYSGQVDYNPLIAEGLIKLNGFFDVFGNPSDNSLNVGLQFSFPFTQPTSTKTKNYFINTGNDVYSSLAYSKKNIYNFYFGISVGITLVNFKKVD